MSEQSQHTPMQPEEGNHILPQPVYPWEGVAALMLVLGVTKEEMPEVWEAMKFSSLPRDPMDAIEIVEHAIEIVASGKPGIRPPADFHERDGLVLEEIAPDED